jgi:hypothetical protein
MRRILFLLVLAVAACGGDQAGRGEEGPPPDTAGGRPDLSRPDAGLNVAITLADSAITLSHDSVQMVGSGQITFAVQNTGATTANFKIEGDQLGEWSSPIPAGQTILMSMLLGRGTYQLLWPEDGSGQRKPFVVH